MKDFSIRISAYLFILFCIIGGFGAGLCEGADLNATIVNGDAEVYKRLLSQISLAKKKDERIIMQEMLAKKLIDLSGNTTQREIVINVPANPDQYGRLFLQYLDWSSERSALSQNIQEAGERLKVLKRQIALLPKDDKDLLSLELQYAFYKKGLKIYRKRAKALYEAMQKVPEIFVKALKTMDFARENIASHQKSLDEDLEKIELGIYKLKIERDRLSLLGRQGAVDKSEAAISALEEKRQGLLRQKLEWAFLDYSHLLKIKDKKVFAKGQAILDIAKSVKDGAPLEQDLSALLARMDSLVLGKARTIHGLTLEEFKDLANHFWKSINTSFVTIGQTPVSILKIVVFCLVIIAGFLVGRFYKVNIKQLSLKNRSLTPSTLTLISNLGYYIIIISSFFLALNVLGIDLSSIALVAGALSVGIGFGLQNMVSNFVSGVILLFERSIKIGDFIELDSSLRGRVRDIRMRSITITTNSNIDVIVPNQDLIQNRVINWTMNDDIRRFEIPFGVAYGTDPQRVMELVTEAVENSEISHIYSSHRRKTRVIMTDMGDSSLDFMLFVWIKGADILRPRTTASRFLVLIYDTLEKNDIEIPFPQRDLHIRSLETDIPVSLKMQDRCSNDMADSQEAEQTINKGDISRLEKG